MDSASADSSAAGGTGSTGRGDSDVRMNSGVEPGAADGVPGARHRRPVGRRRLLVGRVGGAVAAQGVTALASLVLQVVAARTLGAAGYGAFALCLAVLIAAVALYTGWVGDSLTVLDRFDSAVRRPVVAAALIGAVAAAVVGAFAALVLAATSAWEAVLFAVLIAVWLMEEIGRRLLIARMEFGTLVVNDCCYFGVTVLVLVGGRSMGFPWSLGLLFAAMLMGSAAAVGLAVVQLPRYELRGLRPSLHGFGAVAGFAGWRSMQATLRPASLLAVRILVAQFGSLGAVAALEGGRLLLAPVQTVINGAAGFLMSAFAGIRRTDGGPSGGARVRRMAFAATLSLVALVLLAGGTVALLLDPFAALLTDNEFQLSRGVVLGWAVYLATWAATLPAVADAVARRQSRLVFFARLFDSLVGLTLAATALLLGFEYDVVPWLLSIGAVITLLVLHTRRQ